MTRATSARTCKLCAAATVEILLDLGHQPVANHFRGSSDDLDMRFPLVWGCCTSCGLSQLTAPFPDEALVPPYPWFSFREPEAHLDEVVTRIMALPELPNELMVGGVSPKDDSTLERLRGAGAQVSWRIDPRTDLGAENPAANVETVQARLDCNRARHVADRGGRVNVLIARHIAEHCASPPQFLSALSDLLADGGHLMIEVPDCAANMERHDYAMIWEEHTLYLTEETAPMLLARAGCKLVELRRYAHPFEDVLVLIGRKEPGVEPTIEATGTDALVDNARAFAAGFAHRTHSIKQHLNDRLGPNQGFALYGAGHHACGFINFHGLADLCDLVIDDTPQKQGLFMAGSGLPILSAAALDPMRQPICLFAFSPSSEDKIIDKHSGFTDGGGAFFSALVDSPRSIWSHIK